MDLTKLLSTDFLTGQILFSGKGLLDILWFLVRNPQAKSLRLAGLILQLIPKYTKVSVKRLINLYRLVQRTNKLNLPRDIVECGVWNGGSAAIMSVADRDNETSGKIRKLGCREAVTDYLKEHQIQEIVLKQADLHGVYFQKPHQCREETVNN